jgi:hypothetical protein
MEGLIKDLLKMIFHRVNCKASLLCARSVCRRWHALIPPLTLMTSDDVIWSIRNFTHDAARYVLMRGPAHCDNLTMNIYYYNRCVKTLTESDNGGAVLMVLSLDGWLDSLDTGLFVVDEAIRMGALSVLSVMLPLMLSSEMRRHKIYWAIIYKSKGVAVLEWAREHALVDFYYFGKHKHEAHHTFPMLCSATDMAVKVAWMREKCNFGDEFWHDWMAGLVFSVMGCFMGSHMENVKNLLCIIATQLQTVSPRVCAMLGEGQFHDSLRDFCKCQKRMKMTV